MNPSLLIKKDFIQSVAEIFSRKLTDFMKKIAAYKELKTLNSSKGISYLFAKIASADNAKYIVISEKHTVFYKRDKQGIKHLTTATIDSAFMDKLLETLLNDSGRIRRVNKEQVISGLIDIATLLSENESVEHTIIHRYEVIIQADKSDPTKLTYTVIMQNLATLEK